MDDSDEELDEAEMMEQLRAAEREEEEEEQRRLDAARRARDDEERAADEARAAASAPRESENLREGLFGTALGGSVGAARAPVAIVVAWQNSADEPIVNRRTVSKVDYLELGVLLGKRRVRHAAHVKLVFGDLD